MKILKIYIILIPILILLPDCSRIEYFPDKPVEEFGTKFLAHAGGGSYEWENRLEGCKYGLAEMDGIECDIQKSSNNSLWLSHSQYLDRWEGSIGNCFTETSDSEIEEINSRLVEKDKYVRLSEIFAYMKDYYPDRHISLDVKGWKPCNAGELNLIKEMNDIAREIIRLSDVYGLKNRVMVESESGDFLYYIHANCNFVETYLTTFGDFELGVSRALHAGFTGISLKLSLFEELSKEYIEMIHEKGLRIQLWTLSYQEEILKAVELNPDYIQAELKEGISAMNIIK